MNTPETTAPAVPSADVLERLAPATVADIPAPNPYALRILLALNFTGKHIYAGTVAPAVVARRRAASKAARIARRAGRK